MAENKKSIIVYADWIDKFETLEDDEAGRLIKHFFRYVNDLNPEFPDKITKVAFLDIQNALKRDLVKWEVIKGKRSDAGKASAEARKLAKEQDLTNSTHVKSVEEISTNPTVSGNVSVSVINKGIKTQVVPTSAIDFDKFIKYFNSKANRKFKATNNVKTKLKARLKDYSKEDIIQAIDNAHLDNYHKENNFKYLTPEFILRPDKLEKFINQPSQQNQSNGVTMNLALN